MKKMNRLEKILMAAGLTVSLWIGLEIGAMYKSLDSGFLEMHQFHQAINFIGKDEPQSEMHRQLAEKYALKMGKYDKFIHKYGLLYNTYYLIKKNPDHFQN